MDNPQYAKFKRCQEWYCIDPDFRARMEDDPRQALASLGFGEALDAVPVRRAIRWILFRERGEDDPLKNPYVLAAQQREPLLLAHLQRCHSREGYGSEKLFAYELAAQARCRMESRLVRQNQFIYYYPFAMELSKGCSVQCSFCGFAAEPHQGDFRYTPENRDLFRGVIQRSFGYFGPILGCCPPYFATEPFDNPDYEKFMADFRQITGLLPQTTTAVANRAPQRLRDWMAAVGPQGLEEHAAVRISIRSLGQFKKIAALFTPEELVNVELVANNPESLHRYSDSGRAAHHQVGSRAASRYSICCLSGMKVNFVERSVTFLEPELPDERYPLGYSVKEVRHFKTVEEFSKILEDFDRLYVHARLPRELPLYFNQNVTIRDSEDVYLFLGDGCGYRIGKNPFTRKIVEGIPENRSFAEIISRFSVTPEDSQRLYAAFQELFARGYLRAGKPITPQH